MEILSPRDYEDLFFEIYCTTVSNILSHMVAGNMEFVFASRNERSFKPKLKLKLEIIMEKRFLDTCQHKYMLCNQCKNLLEERDLQSF